MSDLEDSVLAIARLAKVNEHGNPLTDESLVNLERALLLASIEMCDHRELVCAVLPAAALRWVVEHLHEPDCPRHDDRLG